MSKELFSPSSCEEWTAINSPSSSFGNCTWWHTFYYCIRFYSYQYISSYQLSSIFAADLQLVLRLNSSTMSTIKMSCYALRFTDISCPSKLSSPPIGFLIFQRPFLFVWRCFPLSLAKDVNLELHPDVLGTHYDLMSGHRSA